MKKRILSVLMILALLLSCLAVVPATAEKGAAEKTAAVQNAAPREITISGSHYVGIGCAIKLRATVLPESASQKLTWKTSDKKIATVDGGKVTGLKKGTVKITAVSKADSTVKKVWKITVTKKTTSVKITAPQDTLYLSGKKTMTLKAKALPSGAAQSFVWKSSNTKVLKVSSSGKVTALKVGEATITCSSVDGSRELDVITIEVKKKKTEEEEEEEEEISSKAKYYALLIGNGQEYVYQQKLAGVAYDLKAFKAALGGLSQSWKITVKKGLTANGMVSAIKKAFKDATKDDICLFYYSGHGDDSTGASGGSLVGINCDGYSDFLKPTTLAKTLKSVCPGKVIVLLDSCGSGSYIYENGSLNSNNGSSRNFTGKVMSAFNYYDENLYSNSGELLGSKFAVLAACEHGMTSTDLKIDDYACGAFTYGMVLSMGCDYPSGTYNGHMEADKDNNNALTLKETYNGIRSVINELNAVLEYYGYETMDQVTQMHGTSGLVLFKH